MHPAGTAPHRWSASVPPEPTPAASAGPFRPADHRGPGPPGVLERPGSVCFASGPPPASGRAARHSLPGCSAAGRARQVGAACAWGPGGWGRPSREGAADRDAAWWPPRPGALEARDLSAAVERRPAGRPAATWGGAGERRPQRAQGRTPTGPASPTASSGWVAGRGSFGGQLAGLQAAGPEHRVALGRGRPFLFVARP